MRRWLLPACVYAALTAALTLPLIRAFGSVFPHDAGDPVLNTWILWWSTRQMPFSDAWWNAPMFHPMAGALALSEVLVGLLPIAAPVQAATGKAIAAYNAAFLLSFPLCGLAAYALALELTARRDAALLAGLAFAFAPYRVGQLAHIQMLSYYWAPVALLALHRYVRSQRVRWLAGFGAAWLMQSLSNGYAMFHLAVLIGLWVIWFGRPAGAAARIVAAWLVASIPLAPMLLAYERVHAGLHLVRDINEIKRSSADLAGFASAPADLTVWGGRLLAARNETAVFPGVTILVIALAAAALALRREPTRRMRWTAGQIGAAAVALTALAVAASAIIAGPWAFGSVLTVSAFHKPFTIAMLALAAVGLQSDAFLRAWRERSAVFFYAAAAIVMYILALGPAPTAFERPFLYEPPYAWLMRLPGFAVLRVPARFAMAAVLCQSALVALAVSAWSGRVNRRLLTLAVGAGLLVDGAFRLPVAAAPRAAYEPQPGVAAILELPPGDAQTDFAAIYRSMFHGRPIVNGYSGYLPPHYIPLAHAVRDQHYEAILELAAYGAVQIAIDDSLAGASLRSAGVGALAAVRTIRGTPGWTMFVVPAHAPPVLRAGEPLAIARIAASRHPEDVPRLLDRDVTTAWGSGSGQDGQEQLVIDLGSPQAIGAVVFEMGAFAFGYPRMLIVDRSEDGVAWAPVWSGDTDVAAVRAALAQPREVPITIPFTAVSARYLRLRQTGREAGIPWWIAELRVCAPPL